MIRKSNLFFLLFFITHFLTSQVINVKGKVFNKLDEELSNIAVMVYGGGKLLSYAYTNEKGGFLITIQKPKLDTLNIVASSLGFKKESKRVSVLKNTININFILEEQNDILEEVVLESWEKIKVKKDTIVYKVSAFKDGSENVVEDLLKNIPGIEIDLNGSIKVNGKAINKLLIEGDDLFDDKYKLLTKNLDASIIKEVEVLTGFEDNPVLKSFQESEKVALNLKLKNNKKNVWFGNIDLGTGTGKRYNTTVNIGLLKKKIKIFNLTNVNSISKTAVSQVKNTETISLNGFDTNKKIEKVSNELISIDNLSSSNFSNNEDVFNNSLLNSLSFVTNLSKQTKLRSLTYFTYDEIEKENDNITQYFIEPKTIFFTEQNKIDIKDILFSTELELKYLSKNETYFTYNFTFENNPTKTTGNLIFNNDNVSQLQEDKKYNFFNHLNFTKKISNNTLLLTYTYLGVNNTKQNYSIQPNTFSDVFNNDEDLTIYQKNNTPLTYYGLNSELVTKTNKAEYGIEFSAAVDRDEIIGSFRFENQLKIDSLSNNIDYINKRVSLTGKYTYDISKLLKISSSLSISKNYIKLNSNKNQFFFVNPKISLHSKKTKVGNFGISYSFQNNLPNSKFLTNSFMLNNYRTFNKGINSIQQSNNHSFGFYYTFNNYKKQFLINSFFTHSFSNKSYGLNSFISENASFNQYTVINGAKFTNYNLSITRYLKSISSSLKLNTQQSWSNNPVIINAVTSKVVNYNANYRLQGTTYFRLPINFKFGIQYNYSKGEFNKQNSTNNYLESNLTANLKISNKWLFKIENNYYSIKSQNYWFSNLNIGFNPEKSKFSYRITANNLSNITKFNDIVLSSFQRNETNYKVIPRYFMLNIKYVF
ncbi:carboxypeptidase-like regulatory domain-containing protein [Tenacibaculum insulae]|uniref:carboxypeptidase-like regulatory domain-containing protein n=1 Tax=Tenacibaculum insulae TaxID=2029677 RepID=UPI003AB6996D